MTTQLRKLTLTSPSRTGPSMISGITSWEKSRQCGHCMSPNSTRVSGASGSPSTVPFCGIPSSRSPVATSLPSSPPPDWLATIRTARTRIAATAIAPTSFILESLSLKLFRDCMQVPQRAGGADRQEPRHQGRACHAPLADRLDHEDLQVGEIEAESEADQAEEQAGGAARIAGRGGGAQQGQVAENADQGDVDTAELGVLTLCHRVATAAPGHADWRATAGLDDRHVARDRQPQQGQDRGRDPEGSFAWHGHRLSGLARRRPFRFKPAPGVPSF